jgi:hypothetical protein
MYTIPTGNRPVITYAIMRSGLTTRNAIIFSASTMSLKMNLMKCI